MKCPNCGLENPSTSLKCDCGYDFELGKCEPLSPSGEMKLQPNVAIAEKSQRVQSMDEKVLPKGVLSKIGGGLAIVSLLFLPLVRGCGKSISGLEVLTDTSIGDLFVIKIMLIVSIGCAVSVFLVKTTNQFFVGGGVGIGGLLGAIALGKQKFPLELELGTFLAIIGFGLILAEGVMTTQQGNNKDRPLFQGMGMGRKDNKFCSQCGAKAEPNVAFCSECGHALR